MINAPKELWHPCFVVIDEAHIFCPEKDKSEASEAVIDLATRGRKRGFCAILATQRLSKLNKDAAAECNNKLIGRTGLDVDMKRASEELGFTSKDQQLSLRNLESGEFFAFGPAISREVFKVKIGDVKTSHPKAGSRILTSAPTPPTERIKRILAELKDLPQEAQEEAKTVEDLKRQVGSLKREISTLKTKSELSRVDPTEDQINKAVIDALHKQKAEYEREIKNLEAQAKKLRSALESVRTTISNTLDEPEYEITISEPEIKAELLFSPTSKENSTSEIQDNSLPEGAVRMLKVLARYPMKFTKSQLATQSHLSPRSGTYGRYISLLKSNQLIIIEGNQISISEEGLKKIGSVPEQIQSSQQVIEMWKSRLPDGAKRIFDYLVDRYPTAFERTQIGEDVGLSPTSGTFGRYISLLRNNGLIELDGGKNIKASENLFIFEDGKRAA